jgi:hypothetical protein
MMHSEFSNNAAVKRTSRDICHRDLTEGLSAMAEVSPYRWREEIVKTVSQPTKCFVDEQIIS